MFEEYLKTITEQVIIYAPKLAGAIIALIIGLYVINIITKSVNKMMKKKDVDESLRGFLKTLLNFSLKAMLVISILSMVGVAIASFVAVLGAAGLAVGMALSGTLQNFAGGVIILIFKPFKVGDFIEAQGYAGVVSKIEVFVTILKTPDNKTIFIPNGGLSTGSMINYSTEENRRVDMTFGIAYGDNVVEARKAIKEIIDEDTRILKDPECTIAVSELADSSVNFAVRVWVQSPDYWNVMFDMNENVYNTFNEKNISIPFPQMDVHVHN